MKILLVAGTRPEVIKIAPVYRQIKKTPGLEEVIMCSTGQHRQMLDQAFAIFDIAPDHDLSVMTSNQTLENVSSRVLLGMEKVLAAFRPDVVLVQGDTTTAFVSALAAFYKQIPVGHVEAGLRTHDIYAPWPEEMNRRLISALATWHFPPTERARHMLLAENIPEDRALVTGNTVIDALHLIRDMIASNPAVRQDLEKRFHWIDPNLPLVLVTGHRRENFGQGFDNICRALRDLAVSRPIQVIYPVHLNPNVRKPVNDILSGADNVHLVEPVDYLSFVFLMQRSHFIITDSGGVQEEAPSLGKPVLVMREKTERPEAIEAGTVLLVGTDRDTILREAQRLLDDKTHFETMARAINPYGDGKASERIVDFLQGKKVDPFRSRNPDRPSGTTSKCISKKDC